MPVSRKEVYVSHRLFGSLGAVAAAIALLSSASIAAAQGPAPSADTPKASTYNGPRTPDGQPDIQGYYGADGNFGEPNAFLGIGGSVPAYDRVWSADSADRKAEIEEQAKKEATGGKPAPPPQQGGGPAGQVRRLDTADARIPYTEAARVKKLELIKETVGNPKGIRHIDFVDTVMRCLPAGVPRASQGVYNYNGLQILQPPGHVVILTEWNHIYRIIPIDGRPHVSKNIKMWMGDSRGRWEGNTLVVDWTNSNGRTWMDQAGSFHSDAIHIVERYTIADDKTLKYEATIEDPNVYTKPFKFFMTLENKNEPGYELYEYACTEGNLALEHALIKN